MRPKTTSVAPVDVDPNGICESQTPAAGGLQSLSLDGALIVDGVFTEAAGARQISVASDGVDTARDFVITGTDPDGYAQTETITGVNATTIEGTAFFKTVTGITVDADTAGAITVGTVDELVSATIPIDWRSDNQAQISVDVTGTIDYTVQETFSPVQLPGPPPSSAAVSALFTDITALADQTTGVVSPATLAARGLRVMVNSYSSGGSIDYTVVQPTGRA